jgi:putative redox protein
MTGSTTERVTFRGVLGYELAARLDLPRDEPRGYALFAHCFTCSKNVLAVSRVSRALADLGIAVLRFDFTGLGNSGGDFENTDFSSNVGDLVAAADWLRTNRRAPTLLIGHSFGGAAVLVAGHQIPEAVAIATIGAPSEPSHVRGLLGAKAHEIERVGSAQVTIEGRSFRLRREFLEDIARQSLLDRLPSLGKALLVMHAPADAIVAPEHAQRIFDAAPEPKSYVSLDGADHLLTRREDATYAAGVLSAWVSRYLPPPAQADRTAEPEPGVVRVEGAHRGKFRQDIRIGKHRLVADEPVSAGGTDTGPSPYGYLLAALGSCTSMTVRLYADLKRMPLEHVAVELSHSRVHAADCAECEKKEGKIDRIERVLTLEGDFDEAARAKLLEIANKCPVHRTLESDILVETRIADPAAKEE